MSDDFDDAQKRLEQAALRNVRGLVDKLEAEDRKHEAVSRVFLLVIVVVTAAFAIGALAIIFAPRVAPLEVVVQPTRTVPPVSAAEPKPDLRRRFVRGRPDAAYAAYVDAFDRRLEHFGNANYPDEVKGILGEVEVTTAIRSDGTIEEVEINKNSGPAALKNAVLRVVRTAAPFDRLSAHGINDVDILHITRTFVFEKRTPKDHPGTP